MRDEDWKGEATMSLQRWDTLIAPQLAAVRNSSAWIKHYSSEACAAVRQLPERPEWPTEAEEELGRAEQEIAQALENIKAARRAYACKPLESAE